MSSRSTGHALEGLTAVWSRGKWLAVVIFLLTAAAAATVVLSLPNLYRATATVLVEQPRADMVVPGELDTRLQVINQEILSRSRLEGLIRRFDLYPGRRGRGSPEVLVAQMRRDIRTEFKVGTQVGGAGSTVAFSLSYRGPNPQTVAGVANALASFYVEQDLRIREQQTSGTVQLLEAQLEGLKHDLQQQERAVGVFQEEHMGELPQHTEATLAALERLREELRTTGEQKARAVDRRDELRRRLETDVGVSGASADPVAARLAVLKQELAEQSRRYSDKYPEVIRLRSEVAALEQQVAAGGPEPAADKSLSRPALRLKESLSEAEAEISSLRVDEGRLRAQIGNYIQRLENAPRRQRDFQEISRDYQTTRDLYDSVRKRYEQAQLEQGSEGKRPAPRFRILDAAVVPAGPIAPNRMLLLFAALVGSLVVAAGAVALRERLDASFHTADDIRSFTRVPVLAAIPLIVTAADRRGRRRRFGLGAVSTLLALVVIVHTFHGFARNQDTLVSMLARP